MPTNVSMRTEIGSIVLATTSVQLANGFYGSCCD
jgi:hypothetical protein